MENKNLKRYLSLSLGVANVLLSMAIATLTGNLISLTVNASAGSESEEVRPRFTVTFNLNGGTCNGRKSIEPRTFEADYDHNGTWWCGMYVLPGDMYSDDIVLGSNGERFIEWIDIDGNGDYDPAMIPLTENIELFARYEKVAVEEVRPRFTVTFNLNGGTCNGRKSIEPRTFEADYNDNGTWICVMLNLPELYNGDNIAGPKGERFIGWYDANGREYVLAESWIDRDIELFAKYVRY